MMSIMDFEVGFDKNELTEKVSFTRKLIYLFIVMSLVSVSVSLIFGEKFLLAINLILIILHLTALYFFRKQKHTFGRLFFITYISTVLTVSKMFFGNQIPIEIGLLLSVGLSYIIHFKEEKKQHSFVLISSSLLFLISCVLPYIHEPIVVLPKDAIGLYNTMYVGTIFGAISWFFFQSNKNEIRSRSRLESVLEEKMAKQKSLNEEIVKNESLNRSLKFKDQFLANMSHEIRTPMNGIIGMVDLLYSDKKMPKEYFEKIQVIKSSSQQLLHIVNDILDLSKLEAGKVELKLKEGNFLSYVSSLKKLFAANAMVNNNDFVCQVSSEIPEVLIFDNSRLTQILTNLLGNAFKFTNNGTVSLDVSLLKESPNEVELLFEVNDTGLGIPEENFKSLFEAFSQLNKHSTKKIEGTGLGLMICKNLVEIMGGAIGVNSKLGIGSKFWFKIPLKKYFGDLSVESPKYKQGSKKITIKNVLIVDDKEVNLQIASLMIKKLGCNVTEAKSGKEAIERFDPEIHDIVLMDIQMPNMDGVETCNIIKMNHPNLRNPIVALTANSMEGDRERYINQGLDDYCPKPFTLESLETILLKWS